MITIRNAIGTDTVFIVMDGPGALLMLATKRSQFNQ